MLMAFVEFYQKIVEHPTASAYRKRQDFSDFV
jgi:hypothetical protein